VGASIGGGVGRFQGVFGLLIDQLLSVRIITANGKLITASKTENSDLFWAVRGAGANFGVITSATYNLPRPINNNQVLNADFSFAASKNASYFDLIQDLKGTIPAELATITITYWNDEAGEVRFLWHENSYQVHELTCCLGATSRQLGLHRT
jgi:FAD/FMN-containing dehydrogenase